MTDLIDSLRDSLRTRAEDLDAVSLSPALLIGSAVRRNRRQRLSAIAAGAACLLFLTLVAVYALNDRTTAGPPATDERIPSGVPLTAVESLHSRAALWASCSDPGQSACDYTVAATITDWGAAAVLSFPSTLVPRLVVLRSGAVAILAGDNRGWVMAAGAAAAELTFPTARIKPSSTVTLTSAPPGTPSSTLGELTQQEIEAGKDTNAVVWAIDEATRTAAPLNMQPGSPARLAAEPVRAGTVTYVALRYPSGAAIDVMTYDDRASADKPTGNVGYMYIQGEPRWPTDLAVGSDLTFAVVLSAPAERDEVWVLRDKGLGTWTQLAGLPFDHVAGLGVTDDGSVVILDADSGKASVYDPLNHLTTGADAPRLLTLRSNTGLLVGVTESGAVASSRDGRNWNVAHPSRAGN